MGGFSIGYGIGISPRTAAFDADALAYFATAGVTDPTAQTQINDFVKGIKDLGLWSSMASWPLRSSQNAGTGTTAYSLGGLGTYNGTLTGGPTWGADGISFDGTNDYVSTEYLIGPSPKFTFWAVANSSSSTGAIFSAWDNNFSTEQFSLVRKNGIGSYGYFIRSGGATRSISGTNTTISGFASIGFGTQSGNTIGVVNGVLDSTLAFLPDETGPQNLWIGIQTPTTSNSFNGIISFCMAFSSSDGLSISQQLLIHNLYKSTLGQGLGLP